jgi:phosphoribosylamine--glycine ligase
MKIAVIGSGGREHAIAWKLEQSELVDAVYVLPGNGGTKNNVDIGVDDFAGIRRFCETEGVELIFVGPEVPLAKGIVDYFADSSIKVFGPDAAGAQLEGSKLFAKRFMQKYGVATAEFYEFGNAAQPSSLRPEEAIEKMQGKCVIKYDGLAAGKGVFVCQTVEQALQDLQELYSTYGSDARFLIEQCLQGDELSILAFTDGKDYQLLLPSQDHKQLLDGDNGPNTGGMGAFCPVPFYNDSLKTQIEEAVIAPTMKGIQAEGFNFHGIVYFGLMITKDGPKVLEYNVRLGDPETEVVLPALKSDLAALVLACFDGSLGSFPMEFNKGSFVDVVLVSGGYPNAYKKGLPICRSEASDQLVFHAGTKLQDGTLVTSGGRVLNIVAQGETLETAIEACYAKVKQFYFDDMFYRRDIGRRRYHKQA